MSPVRRFALLLASCAALAGCGRWAPDESQVKDVRGLLPDLAFSVTDERGRTVEARDFRGQAVLVYFGFTHCPDVCPTTLARLVQAANAAQARDLRILFVTVDPARDTVAQLSGYVHSFGPLVTGLRPAQRELEALARRYRVSYSRGKPDARGDYDVMHSSGVFAFDRDGHARLLILGTASMPELEAALRSLAAPAGGKA